MKDVEIIVGSYKDEQHLMWFYDMWRKPSKTNGINYSFKLYEKTDELKRHMEHCVVSDRRVKLANFGRCDYAFLFHIVNNYDRLSDYNVFVKTHWQIQHIPFFEMLKKAHEYDFLDAGGFRKWHIWDRALIEDQKQIDDFMVDNNVNPLDIERLFLDYLVDDKLGCFTKSTWYHEIFRDIPAPKGFLPLWGDGPCFSVSKELIHRHPKHVYEYLLNFFNPEHSQYDNVLETLHKVNGRKYSLEEACDLVGRYYHDELLRFYRVLFIHNADEKFKSYFM